MKPNQLVSIIINNYNYGSFLREAIDSALNQTYSPTEVIVVDDGSTDISREIISSYGNRIISVLKNNGGQASSLNQGFEVSQGKIIFFLDSDDMFKQDKIEKIVSLMSKENLVDTATIFHNSFEAIDSQGCLVEKKVDIPSDIFRVKGSKSIHPDLKLFFKISATDSFFNGELSKVCTSEQVYQFASRYRYIPYVGMPTSSISVSRSMGKKLFPLPTSDPKISADDLIVKAASLIGSVYSINLILTQYRLHGNNGWYGQKSTREMEEASANRRDEYLNLKLQEIGNQPVFSFLTSMSAGAFYRHYFGRDSGNHLIALSFEVLKWRVDLTTIHFFAKTFMRGICYKISSSAH